MDVARYAPGTSVAVLGEQALVVLGSDPAVAPDRLWAGVRTAASFGDLVARLNAGSTAIAVREGDGVRVFVRGALRVTVRTAAGDTRGLTSTAPDGELIAGARSVEVAGDEPVGATEAGETETGETETGETEVGATGTADEDPGWPLLGGVVRVGRIAWPLPVAGATGVMGEVSTTARPVAGRERAADPLRVAVPAAAEQVWGPPPGAGETAGDADAVNGTPGDATPGDGTPGDGDAGERGKDGPALIAPVPAGWLRGDRSGG